MSSLRAVFGIGASDPRRTWPDTVALVLHAERLGYGSVCMWDHPHFAGVDVQTGLAALAQATTRIRLWSNVMSVPMRPPSIMAKFAASVDWISQGRLILGLGTGWNEAEFRALGLPFHSKPARNKQLIDAIRIARAMWTQERATYHGETWSIEDLVCEPKPVQRPGPPIWVGTHGGPRMMREVVIPLADGVNIGIPSSPESPPLQEVVANLKRACAEAQRDPAHLTISVNTLILGRSEAPSLSDMYSGHFGAQKLIHIRERQRIVDHVGELLEAGVSHFMMAIRGGDAIADCSELREVLEPFYASS